MLRPGSLFPQVIAAFSDKAFMNEADNCYQVTTVVHALAALGGDESRRLLLSLGNRFVPFQRQSLRALCRDIDALLADYNVGLSRRQSAVHKGSETDPASQSSKEEDSEPVLAAAARAVAAIEEVCQGMSDAENIEKADDYEISKLLESSSSKCPPDVHQPGADQISASPHAWHSRPSVVSWFSTSPHANVRPISDAEAERKYVEGMAQHLLDGVEGLQSTHQFRSKAGSGVMLGRTTRKLMQVCQGRSLSAMTAHSDTRIVMRMWYTRT